MDQDLLNKMKNGKGFIAALDQSGGSTPKALQNYGINPDEYQSEEDMFQLVHDMRTRIITSPSFTSDKILGAILFEKTMDAHIASHPTPTYLLDKCGVIPFLKVDKGLEDEKDGVQLMKDIPNLDSLLDRAVNARIFGTKMRSVIHGASPKGIANVIEQQFDVGKQIIAKGFVPIIEPEISISAPDKAECEKLMRDEILKHLNQLSPDQHVMLKLTLPEDANFFQPLISHQNVVRVVALSGGYDLSEACRRLAQNDGMIASFSRALTNDLSAQQDDESFNSALAHAVETIYDASVSGKAQTQAA